MATAKEMRDANPGTLAVPRELEKHVLPPYVVEPGDVLLVQTTDLESSVRLPGDQPVLPDGTINLGKYGQLVVAGKTIAEIEGMVKATVTAKTKDAGFIGVRLVSRQSKVYYVLGEVNAPGVFQLSGRETVLDGILAAGGLTDRASRDNIIMTHPSKPDECRTVLRVCYRHIVQLGDTSTNYQLAPGDRIYVPTRSTWSFLCRKDKPCCDGINVPCILPPYAGSHDHSTPDAHHVSGNGLTVDNPFPAPLVIERK